MRHLERIVVFVHFAILVAAAALTFAGISVGAPLNGVTTPPPKPAFSIARLGSEAFQKDATAWFEARWSPRPIAVRLDNSISYWLFDETRLDKTAVVGPHHTLFLKEMFWGYNRQDTPNVEAAAERVARVHDAAKARGKAFVLVLFPDKTAIWGDSVPSEWSVQMPEPRPTETRAYAPFVEALRRRGVDFVDGRALLAELARADRELVYARSGRHVTGLAACTIVHEVFRLASPTIGVDPNAVDCRYDLRADAPIAAEDFDIFRVLNVWGPPPTRRIPQMPTITTTPDARSRPDVLFTGSSFVWRLLKELERNHALGRTHAFYYNKTVYDWADQGHPFPVEPYTPKWRELVLSKSLYIADMPEEFMLWHNDLFFDQLATALEEAP